MTRPWRLTRRQRVEMEAALRADVADGYHRRSPCAATGYGWRLLCGVPVIPCEEAYAAAGCPAWGHADLGDVMAYDAGALAALDLLREWPGLARDLDTGRVQLALWEVVR